MVVDKEQKECRIGKAYPLPNLCDDLKTTNRKVRQNMIFNIYNYHNKEA